MNRAFDNDGHEIFGRRLFDLWVDDILYELPFNAEGRSKYLIGAFAVVSHQCESPIEIMMGAGLVCAHDGTNWMSWFRGGHLVAKTSIDDLKKAASRDHSIIAAQVDVGTGYRVDFLIASVTDRGDVVCTAIECDGHDYHERTKEQASRDKERDRRLAAAGITTLRFTGSDIHRDLDKCIDEIQQYLAGCRQGRQAAA